ncbi:hypothetical protein DCD74_09820 [Lysobacter oculi]|uniref:Uncharacterized protein n=1 Tax=Solilutibacter oculi TaxID=2698682 RepID=A0A344J7C5_9GAMM|nr:hypothetical protein [Lysobacter oculi]AXA84935.1 hypothetical protein DCD74_09820 [Lysobacter oculi]
MNVENTRTPAARETAAAEPAPRRSSRRERSFGTGYGRSSGYADGLRRYIDSDTAERFRVH